MAKKDFQFRVVFMYELHRKQAVVRGTTNPAPVLPLSQRTKTAISLHSQKLGGSTGLPEDHNRTK